MENALQSYSQIGRKIEIINRYYKIMNSVKNHQVFCKSPLFLTPVT